MDRIKLIEAAIAIFGDESKLARAAGVSQALVSQAKINGQVGPKLAIGVDNATKGVISKGRLRPDLWPD